MERKPGSIIYRRHSAGGHLASMLMTKEKDQNEKSFIKGVCAISGIFDLEPIQLSNINDVLQMGRETAINNSPVIKEPFTYCPLLLAVGADETPEFRDQSQELYNNWKNKNKGIDCLEIRGINHFSILSSIDDRNSLLHESLLRMIIQ